MSFRTVVTGKWILAGEHSVLRGSPAIVFPLYSRVLEFEYERTNQVKELTLELSGEHGEEMQLLFWGVIEKACKLKKVRRVDLIGKIKLRSSIPIGAGLGASAALCSAVARLFHFLKLVQESELFEFARNLENLFHGESSGVDVAVALSGKPLIYTRGGTSKEFTPLWQPNWFLSYSGKRGVTLDCVNKVKELISKDYGTGTMLDDDMRVAVGMCEAALSIPDDIGFAQLVTAIESASHCFEKWGLTEGCIEHMKLLKKHGAAAVKPTGSGNGGYILSLWPGEPSREIRHLLIPCF